MTIKDRVQQKIDELSGIQKISNPNSERLLFIEDEDAIRLSDVRANKIWFTGSGDELLNFYTNAEVKDFLKNIIYNRNKRNYFWSISTNEWGIKRVHSGIPHAIVTTLSDTIEMPKIKEPTGRWEKIAEENDFYTLLSQQIRPLTLVEGTGVVKINFDKSISKHPSFEFYDAENVELIYKANVLMGVVFKSYYKKNNTNYILLESRYRANGNSYIDYELYQLGENYEIARVALNEIPELANLEDIVIPHLNKVAAVVYKYFYDPLNTTYGKSIFDGKLDLFDDLDQSLSINSRTVQVSVPVDYVSVDALDRGPNGEAGYSHRYDRTIIAKSGTPNGDGMMKQDIYTSQPSLNFDQYNAQEKHLLDLILTGVLSPATMGIDIAKKDNAEAQREKEKVTIMTRNNIMAAEERSNKQLVELALFFDEYIETGEITIKDYDIGIKYNEFANPSFENQIQTLGSAWVNGEISTKRYVDLLWGDSLTDEEKLEEINELEENRNNVFGDESDLPEASEEEEGIGDSSERLSGESLQ